MAENTNKKTLLAFLKKLRSEYEIHKATNNQDTSAIFDEDRAVSDKLETDCFLTLSTDLDSRYHFSGSNEHETELCIYFSVSSNINEENLYRIILLDEIDSSPNLGMLIAGLKIHLDHNDIDEAVNIIKLSSKRPSEANLFTAIILALKNDRLVPWAPVRYENDGLCLSRPLGFKTRYYRNNG